MTKTLYFLLALYFWQVCDGVSTRTLIGQTLKKLNELNGPQYQGEELTGCPQLMAKNISRIPHIKGQKDPMIEVTFRLASKLFQNNNTRSKWDTNVLKQLQDLLHRLHSDKPTSGSIPTIAELVQTHFTQLEELLSHENFSMCAWETVRKHMRNTLYRFLTDLRSHSGRR